jgi:hypothetical protein
LTVDAVNLLGKRVAAIANVLGDRVREGRIDLADFSSVA